MKFYEFGKENEQTLLLLHGNCSTWEMSFGKSIPVLAEKYHVIAVGLDGFDPTENSEYISDEEEADKIIVYIRKNLGGKVFAIYGSSLGCSPAVFAYLHGTVKVDNLILDGSEYINFVIFNPLLAKIEGKIVTRVARGKATLLLKMMGLSDYTPEELSQLIYSNASTTTLENATKAGTSFYKRIQGLNPHYDFRVACWYGSKESNMKKAVKLLRKLFPNLKVKSFEGYSHGDIHQHPEILRTEIDHFLHV